MNLDTIGRPMANTKRIIINLEVAPDTNYREKTMNNKKYLVYGYDEGIMWITKAPSITAYIFRSEIRGKYNLKAHKEWKKRLQSI